MPDQPPPSPSPPSPVRRIAIVGPGGAGKSTLARRLGERTGLPVVHLDHLYWRPGWVPTPDDEWRAVQETALAGDAWIADGNYSRTIDVRFRRADLIVLCDLHPVRCLVRVARRTWRNRRTGASQAPGCEDKLDAEFARWILTYRRRSRPRVLAAIAAHGGQATVLRLRSPAAVERFASSFG